MDQLEICASFPGDCCCPHQGSGLGECRLDVSPNSGPVWAALRVAQPEVTPPLPLASKLHSIPSLKISFCPPTFLWILYHKSPKNRPGSPDSSVAAGGGRSLEHIYDHLCPVTVGITFRTGEASTFEYLGVRIGTSSHVFKWSEPENAQKNLEAEADP